MGHEFSSIFELREIYRMKDELSYKESALSKPILTDYSLLPLIYKLFSEECIQERRISVTDRMKFIFITLFLYAPSSLAGRKMPDGLRAALSSLFPSLSPCVLSNNKKQTVFFYEIYKRYGEELNAAYRKIMQRLDDIEETDGNPQRIEHVAVQLPFVFDE